ncbi:MAG: ATP-binding cassette domain-containing protein, partial [Promethearchaeota archaeon]
MILNYILQGAEIFHQRLYKTIFESLVFLVLIPWLFFFVVKISKSSHIYSAKLRLKVSIPMMWVIIIIVFGLRLLLERFQIRTGLFFFLAIQYIVVCELHLKIFKSAIMTSRFNEHFDYYSQYKPDFRLFEKFFIIIGIVNQLAESIEFLQIRENITMSLNFSVIVLLFAIGISKLINKMRKPKNRIESRILLQVIKLTSMRVFMIWGFQLVVVGWIFQGGYLFNIFGYSIFLCIYAGLFIYFAKKLTNEEIHRVESTILQIQQEKAKSVLNEEEKSKEVVLDVQNLTTYFYTDEGIVRAVEGVSFKIFKNDILGLVGETGCGKSVTALSILRLVSSPGKIIKGKVLYRGEDLLQKTNEEILDYRGNKITMMFQDPLNSINPLFKVGEQISEVFLLHMYNELYLEKMNYEATEIDPIRKQLRNFTNEIEEIKKQNQEPDTE